MHVIFIFKDGTKKEARFIAGDTVLQAAINAGINLDSRCEGNGVCGGCHVIIQDQKDLSATTQKEETGLDFARHVTLNSRLACQVILSEKNDGLEINIP